MEHREDYGDFEAGHECERGYSSDCGGDNGEVTSATRISAAAASISLFISAPIRSMSPVR